MRRLTNPAAAIPKSDGETEVRGSPVRGGGIRRLRLKRILDDF
jgi:hypothetical protein